MDVVRDVLDKPVVDRNGRAMGRVDGIIVDQRGNEPPRLSAVLIGPSALGDRLHPTLGRWVAALENACGVGDHRPVHVDFHDVTAIADDIKVAAAIGETAAAAIEQRIRAWLATVPGAR